MIYAIKGMNDLLDEKGELYARVIAVCEKHARAFGYSFINVPHLEQSLLFRRGVGESSDIVGKEMYEFKDKNEQSLCLRPEGTAGVVRAFIEKKMDKAGGVKRWFYHGSMFRYEKPQRGRYREFHQFGVECFCEKSVYEDANIIIMLANIFAELGIAYTLKINSLGTKETLNNYRAKLRESLKIDDFCEDCRRRWQSNVIRILDCKNEKCQSNLVGVARLSEFYDDECASDFAKLQEILKAEKIAFEIDEKLVRGLDYYSKTAFEFISDEIGAKAAIAGGGRYDYLVAELGGKQSCGVGFAMGIERVMDILESKNEPKNAKNSYFCSLDDEFLPLANHLANELRKANFCVKTSYEAKKINKHLNAANKANCKHFYALGSDEVKNGCVFYKNLESGEQELIKFEDLLKKEFDEK